MKRLTRKELDGIEKVQGGIGATPALIAEVRALWTDVIMQRQLITRTENMCDALERVVAGANLVIDSQRLLIDALAAKIQELDSE